MTLNKTTCRLACCLAVAAGALLIGPRCCVQQHVAALSADFLVTAQQSFSPICSRFGNTNRGRAPRLDIQFDPVQGRDGPREGCQRTERIRLLIKGNVRIFAQMDRHADVVVSELAQDDRTVARW